MTLNPNNRKMNRKVFLISSLSLVIGLNLNGQFQKKSLMAGGEIQIPILSENEDGSKHYFFNPKVGYFLLDNFVIGLNVETSLFTLDDNRRTELGAGPLVRYYYNKNRVYGFAHFSYLANLVMFNTTTTNEFQSTIQPGLGIGYLLSPTIGIDAFFSYDFFNTNDEYADRQKYTSSSLKIGLQIYFPAKLT